MTPENFIYFLSGYLSDLEKLDKEQLDKLKEKMKTIDWGKPLFPMGYIPNTIPPGKIPPPNNTLEGKTPFHSQTCC